jgi:hypothetical protein
VGNGFKSGSTRIGRDAIVFTCDGRTRTVALLSQSYLAAIRAEEVLVPMVLSWESEGKKSEGKREKSSWGEEGRGEEEKGQKD